MAEVPQFPVTWYHPERGVARDFPDAAALGEALREFDTDDIAVTARQWLVDCTGRRVRARVVRGAVARLEILPGRPPEAGRLAQLREAALRAEEDQTPAVRQALIAARIVSAVLAPLALAAALWNWWAWISVPVFATFQWDQPLLLVTLLGAVVLAASWANRRRRLLAGLVLLLGSAAALGAVRGLRLFAGAAAPGGTQGLARLVAEWAWNLAFPGLAFVLAALLLLAYGHAYLLLARRRGRSRAALLARAPLPAPGP